MRLKASVILCAVGLVLIVLGVVISRMGNHDLAHLFGMAGVTLGLTVVMRARGAIWHNNPRKPRCNCCPNSSGAGSGNRHR